MGVNALPLVVGIFVTVCVDYITNELSHAIYFSATLLSTNIVSTVALSVLK